MSQREMRRTEENAGDFLENILHMGDFTKQFKCG